MTNPYSLSKSLRWINHWPGLIKLPLIWKCLKITFWFHEVWVSRGWACLTHRLLNISQVEEVCVHLMSQPHHSGKPLLYLSVALLWFLTAGCQNLGSLCRWISSVDLCYWSDVSGMTVERDAWSLWCPLIYMVYINNKSACILKIQGSFLIFSPNWESVPLLCQLTRWCRIFSMRVTQHYRESQQCNITLLMVTFCETSFTQEIGEAQVTCCKHIPLICFVILP